MIVSNLHRLNAPRTAPVTLMHARPPLLAVIACVGPTDEKTIEQAIATVKVSEMNAWTKKEIRKSLQSQRRSIRKIIRDLIGKTVQNLGGISEGEAMGF